MKSSESTPFPPILNEVLKEYQNTAMSSLSGPNNVFKSWKLSHGNKDESVPLKKRLSPITPSPPSSSPQFPILLPPDQSSGERGETLLEGQLIACFSVGGERRLCLPQILNSVLSEFQLPQINHICDALQIFCSRCTPEQLDELKRSGILPPSAYCCGLITKTNAERLCMELLHSSAPQLPMELSVRERPRGFHVYHRCFGKGRGIFIPDWYTSSEARCIECIECKGMFSPEIFIGHYHGSSEYRTCHWGFDRANWRFYLYLTKSQPDVDFFQKTFDDLKARFDGPKHKRKKTEAMLKDAGKKSKLDDLTNYIPYSFDPFLYWPWFNMFFNRSAIPPMWSSVDKDEKNHPHSLLKENSSMPFHGYSGQNSPFLFNPNGFMSNNENLFYRQFSYPGATLPPKEIKNQNRLRAKMLTSTVQQIKKEVADENDRAQTKASQDKKDQEGSAIENDTEENFIDDKISEDAYTYNKEILQKCLQGVDPEICNSVVSFVNQYQTGVLEKFRKSNQFRHKAVKKISHLVSLLTNMQNQQSQQRAEMELLKTENDKLFIINCKLRKELESARNSKVTSP